MGSACFQIHQLAAVLDVSLSVSQMTFDSLQTNGMGGDDNVCEFACAYVFVKCCENCCLSVITSFATGQNFLLIVLSCFHWSDICSNF
jgi:hypothetical protein